MEDLNYNMANQFSQMSILEINIAVATRLGYTIEPMNNNDYVAVINPDNYVALLNPEGLYLRTLRFDGDVNNVWGALFKTGFLPDYASRIEASIWMVKDGRFAVAVDGENWLVLSSADTTVANTSLPRAICEAWLLWKVSEK
jgi:hypothetical protein